MKQLNKLNIKLSKMILFQRKGHEVKLNAPMEVSWDEASIKCINDTDCVEMNSNEFAYILVYIRNYWNTKRYC